MKIVKKTLLLLVTFTWVPLPVAASGVFLMEDVAQHARHPEWRAQAQALLAIYSDLAEHAEVEATFLYALDPDINALATVVREENVIVFLDGLVEYFKDDLDALAAVLGHELAHLQADHVEAGLRKQQRARRVGSVLGTVAGIAVGDSHGALAGAASEAAVGLGGNLVALKFNRRQELEADRLSVEWMIAAGYDPEGMLRLQRRLGELAGTRRGSLFASHPVSDQRTRAIQALIDARELSAEQRGLPPRPLVSEEALAASEAAIRAEARR
jgi:predicted Zn-dependent protease